MTSKIFDPMCGTISTGEAVPAGVYTAAFIGAEYLPAKDPDPMTGKGGQKFDDIKFTWEITKVGEHLGKKVSTKTPNSNGTTSRFTAVVSWLLGPQVAVAGGAFDLKPTVGKIFMITIGTRPNKKWVEVVIAIAMPD